MFDPTPTEDDDTRYVIEPDGFAWAGDFHYIEDIIPDADEATKLRVWNRIMGSIEETQ